MGRSILVVEDEAEQGQLIDSMLRGASLEPDVVEDTEAALGALARRSYGAVLSDIRLRGRSGIELVREARRLSPDTPVVVMTGYPTLESAVESIRAGAFDYIQKPFKREELLRVLQRALARTSVDRRGREVTTDGRALGGASRLMRDLDDVIARIASHDANVLLTGESGTGKERVARRIHALGPRQGAAFVAINCAAIPEGLLESELFGHVRGAFTGASEDKRGLFYYASGGSVLLDEIGDMSLALQVKLLRVLEEREVRPVGGETPQPIDVRIIAATHRHLEDEVAEGRFRRDLFYRLNVIPLRLPALREHPEDIEEIARAFLARREEGEAPELSGEALAMLRTRPWRGNVRELENVLERAMVMCDDAVIRPADLALFDDSDLEVGDEERGLFRSLAARRMTLDEVEERLIEETLDLTSGNKVAASRILGLSRRTLQRRAHSSPGARNEDPGEGGEGV
ncbi:MAG: sigma-54 dependent transcriptional regulator [Myxococcota bacterium]